MAHTGHARFVRTRPWSETRHRLPRVAVGLVLVGTGIAATVNADLGLGPWDVLHQGIADRTGIAIGTVTILVGLVVLLAWIPLGERPGVGTLMNLVGVGLTVDAVLALWSPPDAMAARIAAMLGGAVLIALGSALYIGGGLGPGPRDGIMTALVARGGPLWAVRTGIELSALTAGYALGGTVGVGTLVQAFLLGPLIHVFLPYATVPEPGDAGATGEAPPTHQPTAYEPD